VCGEASAVMGAAVADFHQCEFGGLVLCHK
jgi:hypothetical protein